MKKLLTLAVVLLTTVSAFAEAEWSWYGSSRFAVWVNSNTSGAEDAEAVITTEWTRHARFGANVKGGPLSGKIEAQFDGENKASLRHLWGKYEFNDDVNVVLGQTWAPLSLVGLNHGGYTDGWGLLVYGGMYAGRQAQIQFNFHGASVALLDPKSGGDDKNVDVVYKENYMPLKKVATTGNPFDPPESWYGSKKALIPSFQATYKYKHDKFNVGLGLAFQTYTHELSGSILAENDDKEEVALKFETVENTITGYSAFLFGGVTLGKFYADFGAGYGSNQPNAAGISTAGSANPRITYDFSDKDFKKNTVKVKSEIVNNTALHGMLALGFKVNDNITPEFGVGYVQHHRAGAQYLDPKDSKGKKKLDEVADAELALYLQCGIKAAEGKITFLPEFAYIDHMTDNKGNNESKFWHFGSYILFNF